MDKEIYTKSILTFVFTNDGRMLVRKNKEEKLDTVPQIFFGYRKKENTTDFEDSIWVINHPDEYKERIAIFIAYHLRNSKKAILDGYFIANANRLLDVGKLHGKIANHQIEEMKSIHTPSFIRVNDEYYDGGLNQNNQQVINEIETRYIVLPADEDLEAFEDLEIIEVDELRRSFGLISSRIALGITGSDGEIMDTFISKLKSLEKSSSIKK